jgi:putative flippase GtrA
MPESIKKYLSKALSKQFARYLIAGGTAFATEYLIFLGIFGLTGMSIVISHSLSFLAGLFVSYTLNRQWVFASDSYAKRISYQMLSYVSLAGFNLIMTNIIINSLVVGGVHPFISKILVMMMVAIWNFLIFRYFIFKTSVD